MGKYFIIIVLLMPIIIFAQNLNEGNSENSMQKYDDIVITGQVNPQSVKESVFEVSVITRQDIERQAGNNLADVLNNTLNLTIIPNSSTGKSKVEMFGLDGQYLKILVDNVPIMNEEGLGNNTDLTQINIDDIERIEIVEGSMGVQYGSNAVAGIINIITKKGSGDRWNISAFIQEETIGKEYNLSDMGRHIQNIQIGHQFNKKMFANISFNRNDFKGFYDNRKGEYYAQNDKLRGYDWLPKMNWNTKAFLNYQNNNINILYKLEYFDEGLANYNPTVHENYNSATQTSNPSANDSYFSTIRIFNNLNLNGNIKNKITYNISVSYQQQKKDVETYTLYLNDGRKENNLKTRYESMGGFYSRGVFSNFLKTEKFNLQLGYELNTVSGYASSLAGNYFNDNIKRRLQSYDGFVSAEYKPAKALSFQPGARLLYDPMYNPLAAYSLSSKYIFKNRIIVRLILGTSPRTPNYDELYTHLTDVNHDVRGNENLRPEKGYSAFLYLKKRFEFNKSDENSLSWQPRLGFWYMNVKDRIDLIISNISPLQYKFENINGFQSTGISLSNAFQWNDFTINLGASFNGASKYVDRESAINEIAPPNDFLFSLQLNGNVSYEIPKINMVVSLIYKYNGEEYQFIQQTNEIDETVFVRATQAPYSWMDASIRKNLWKKLEVTIGVRNLFDITKIETKTPTESIETSSVGHSSTLSQVMLGYGRSYFVKLSYNLNFK